MKFKQTELLDIMKDLGVSLPETGTGPGNRIVSRDLENAIGDHYYDKKYFDKDGRCKDLYAATHCTMRRALEPMKAFRYDKLHSHEQEEIMRDGSDWVGEQKFNGWRIMATYIPGDGFMFWGGNLSTVDFLPTDYTDHVLLDGLHPRSKAYAKSLGIKANIDCEAVCYSDVEMTDGSFSSDTLDAIGAILGSDPAKAVELQEEHKIVLHSFDIVPMTESHHPQHFRKTMLAGIHAAGLPSNFRFVPSASINKKQVLKNFWIEGEEGMIFKNKNEQYDPGGRHRTVAVKVKRTMSGEIGDDIDAFIIGWKDTPEYGAKNLIGAIKLGVYVDKGGEKVVHHIATVSAMPDDVREALSFVGLDGLSLAPSALGQVLVVDGQELSHRNKMIMHAKVDWRRGPRRNKSKYDCTFDMTALEEEKF